MDFIGVLTFSGMSVTRYFLEIGLRYIAIASTTIVVGYVLQTKLAPK